MIGKCLDSNGSEVRDWKFVRRFFLDRGVMKSSRREKCFGLGLAESGGGTVSRGVMSEYVI